MGDAARSPQALVLSPFASYSGARASQLTALVPFGPPQSKKAQASQLVANVASSGDVTTSLPAASQLVALVAYTTAAPEDNTLRAFVLKFDGHVWYGITLGEFGTYLRDTISGAWTRFQTGGFSAWNFQQAVQWRDRWVGFDIANPTIFWLDPSSTLDDGFRTIERRATAVHEHRGFTFVPHYSLTFFGSLGEDSPDGATVTLSYSDDNGQTYSTPASVTIEPGAYNQRVSFRSLGSIREPGRFFRLEDEGGMLRIDAIEAEIGKQS